MAIHRHILNNQKQLFYVFKISSLQLRLSHHSALVPNDEPKYPPIIEYSPEGLMKHERMLWYDTLKALPTVDEKLHAFLLKKKKWQEPVHRTGACAPCYAAIPFQHYITRTHLIHNSFPEKLMTINVDEEFSSLKETLCETLATHYTNPWAEDKGKQLSDYLTEKDCGSTLVRSLLAECSKKLALEKDYLLQSTFQQSPKFYSFWWHSGFNKDNKWVERRNLIFNFHGSAVCAIRMKKNLPPILPLTDALCTTSEVIDFNYHPKIFGIPQRRHYYPKTSPGFWSGDPYEFPLLQVYSSHAISKLRERIDKYNLQDIEDGLGVMSSFGWLNGIAQYQGFTPFHDITYPMVAHTILTNGQDWTFYTYQLNTISFHEDVDKRDRRNICWSSGKMRLFETVEDGQVKGINDEVFKMLLRLHLYAPEMNSSVELKPYLGEDTRSAEEILTMKAELHKMLRNFKTAYDYQKQITLWQRIYKYHKDAPPSPSIRME